MSHLWKNLTLAVLALLLAIPSTLPAQQIKPIVVVSIAPIEKQRQDVGYLAELVGEKGRVDTFLNFAPVFLNGVDMKRPSGGYLVAAGGGEFKFVAFVPVTNLDTLLKTYKEQIGAPADAGGGILRLDPPQGDSVYLKEVKGWAYASNDKVALADLPADPLALLGTLPTLYNVAIKANVHDIPAELRATAMDAIQSGIDRGLEENPAADREMAEKMSRMSAKQFQRMIEEMDQVTIGWGVDRTLKATYIDTTITAVSGTTMAKQMALLKDGTSSFAGFLLPGSAVTLNGSTRLAKEDVDQYGTLLDLVRTRTDKEIDNDAGLDANQRVSAKELTSKFFDVLGDTIKQGKIDYGATLMLEEKKLSFAAGILVADGKKLETAFAKLVELAKNEPDFPDVKLNASKHGDVALHTVSVDIPASEEEARQLFGEKLNVVVGTAPTALYVAFGKEGESLMKKAIDASAARASDNVPPSQINVFLKPIAKFASSMDDNATLQSVLKSVDSVQASDEINIFSKPIPSGVLGRLQVSEGVLKIIGAGIKAAQSNR